MVKSIIAISVLIVLFACKHSHVSFEALKKAKWDTLQPGIEYVSTEDSKGNAGDSIEFIMEGSVDQKGYAVSFSLTPSELNKLFRSLLTRYLHHSKTGYVKVNFDELSRATPLFNVVLMDDPRSNWSFSKDSLAITKLPGIRSVHLFSEQDILEIQRVADSDKYWRLYDKDPSPLIEVKFDERIWKGLPPKDMLIQVMECLGDAPMPMYCSNALDIIPSNSTHGKSIYLSYTWK